MSTIIAIAAAFGLVVVAIFIAHVAISAFMLKNRTPLLVKGDANFFEWHIIIPALDEESVIGSTINSLLELQPQPHLWVIDDASKDSTRQIIQTAARSNNKVHLVARDLPNARTGKGDALNNAYFKILERHTSEATEATEMTTVVGVVDADGELMPEVFDVLSGVNAFGDPQVGGVQQDVWMKNADDQQPLPSRGKLANFVGSVLLKLQDIEFRAAISGIQNTRHQSASVSMGGNGQWSRLAALKEIAERDRIDRGVDVGVPWHGSLLEDFELGLHLMLSGWKTRYLPGLWVAQEALPEVGLYIRQRTRWTQGTMQCIKYIPTLWKAPYVGPWALLEIFYYLLQPWFWIVGTFLFPLPLYDAWARFAKSPEDWLGWVQYEGGWMWLVMFWLVALGPLMSWGFTYRRIQTRHDSTRWYPTKSGQEVLVLGEAEDTKISRRKALAYGFAYVWLVQLSYIIAWKAFFRLLRGQNGWVKTSRNAEISKGQVRSIETENSVIGAKADA